MGLETVASAGGSIERFVSSFAGPENTPDPFYSGNEERMHSTIGDVTPMEFIHNHQDLARTAQECTSSAVV